MSSVFGISVADVMRRVTSTSASGAEKGRETFAEALRSAEGNSKISNKSNILPTNMSLEADSSLSNWTLREKLEAAPPTAPPQRLSTLPELQLQESSVKGTGEAVKTLPTSAEKPEKPRIVRVNRVAAERVRREQEMTEIITTAGRFHGVDPGLSLAVARAESDLRPEVVSRDGHSSKGIFQLLDSTARGLLERFQVKDAYDPFDPGMNSFLGVGYLRHLHDIFSEETDLGGKVRTIPVKSASDLEKLAVAAFNAGEGSVAEAQHKARSLGRDPTRFSAIEPFLPASTRDYVAKVTRLRTRQSPDDDSQFIA